MVAQLTTFFTSTLSVWTSKYLVVTMFAMLVSAVVLKFLIYYVTKKQFIIAKEFELRVHRHLEGEYEHTKGLKFFSLVKEILNKTYHDHFIMRAKNLRRRADRTAAFLDRFFYIDAATQNLFEDTSKQAKYLQFEENPNMKSVTNFTFSANNYFNNLFGFLPLRVLNSFLNILPGLFIIGGIFGTFLGIVNGIPALKGLDPQNLEATKFTISTFLDQMAFSMNTSIVGIMFSVITNLFNTLLSPRSIQAEAFTKYTHSLEFLWKNAKAQGKMESPEAPRESEGPEMKMVSGE